MKDCKTITKLISLGNEQKLTFNQQCTMSVHLLFCPYCRVFKQNSKQMRALIKQFKQREE